MEGKASMFQMHSLLLEFYFKSFCTSNARNLFLLIILLQIDISYNKIVLFSMNIKFNHDCLVPVFSQSNLM